MKGNSCVTVLYCDSGFPPHKVAVRAIVGYVEANGREKVIQISLKSSVNLKERIQGGKEEDEKGK